MEHDGDSWARVLLGESFHFKAMKPQRQAGVQVYFLRNFETNQNSHAGNMLHPKRFFLLVLT